MTKKAKSKKQSSRSVRLKSQIELRFKAYFLHYINTLTPEVSKAIKKLTAKCQSLFGQFPFQIDTANDYKGLGVYFYKPSPTPEKIDEEREFWSYSNLVFRELIWSESRQMSEGYRDPVLRKNDAEYNDCLKRLEEIDKTVEEKLKPLSKEQLDLLAENLAKGTGINKDSIQEIHLIAFIRSYFFNEEYEQLFVTKFAKIKLLSEFQQEFDSLLEKFCLNKQWLAESVFRAIWSGTGKLQIESSFMENIPKEVIYEAKKELNQKRIVKIGDKEIDEYEDLFMRELPAPNPFVYSEKYSIYGSFADYEIKAVEAYRQHLQYYFSAIEKAFKKFGYKSTQGDSFDDERVKWLVWWNIKKLTKVQILEKIEKETRKETDGIGRELDRTTINTAFNNFKKYDLPVCVHK